MLMFMFPIARICYVVRMVSMRTALHITHQSQ